MALGTVEEVLEQSLIQGMDADLLPSAGAQLARVAWSRAMSPASLASWASWGQHLGRESTQLPEEVADAQGVEAALQELAAPVRRTWLIVGDLSVIEPVLSEAGVQLSQVWDAQSLWEASAAIDE